MSHSHLTNGQIMSYDKTITNIHAYFSDGKFVCSSPGLYAFHFYAVTKKDEKVWLELFKNNQYVISVKGRTPSDFVDTGNSVFLYLEGEDVVYVKARDQYDSLIYGAGDQVYTTFTGVLIADKTRESADAFSVGLTHSMSLSAQQHVLYDRIITFFPNYDSSTGIFTAAIDGIYIFHYHAMTSSRNESWLELYSNDQYINSAYGMTPNGYADTGNTAILYLHSGDKMSVRSRRTGGIYGDIGTNQTYTTFSGAMLPFTSTANNGNGQTQEVAFSVGLSTHFTQGQGHIVMFDKVIMNHGLGFDTRTGKFTAKYNGIYVFHFHALSQHDKPLWIDLYHNFLYVNSIYGHVPSGYVTGSNSASLELIQGDEVYLDIKSHDTALFGNQDQIYCTFSGYLLSTTSINPPVIGKYVFGDNS